METPKTKDLKFYIVFFPVQEFFISEWFINLVFNWCSCWSSGVWGVAVALILRYFCRAELHYPYSGGRAQCKLLQVALCSFCSLKAFAALKNKKKKKKKEKLLYPVSSSRAEWLLPPLFSALSGKSSQSLLFTSNSEDCCGTHPHQSSQGCVCVCVWRARVSGRSCSLLDPCFWSNFLIVCASGHSSKGKEQGLPAAITCWVPAWRVVSGSCSGLQFMATPSWETMPRLINCSRLPSSSAWELRRLRHPCSFCDPGDPETLLSHLGFCPTSLIWSPFRQGYSSQEQTSKSSHFALRCYITFQ